MESLSTKEARSIERKIDDLVERQVIEDSLSRYSLGIDNREWANWEGLFTQDALLDYSAIGVGVVSPEDFRALVTKNDSVRIAGQHLHSNVMIEIDGDSSIARAEYTMHNLVRLEDDPGFGRITHAGGWVEYELSRERGSWLISRRITHTKWSENARLAITS